MAWQDALERLEGAYAHNTLRSYRADFASFDAWCVAEGRGALPASPETLAGFIAAEAPKVSAATLKRRLAGIRKVHRLFQYHNPAADELVQIALRRALRAKLSRPKQALGLTAELRDRLAAVCGDDLTGLRDRALILTGYDTLCRRAELAALRLEDLSPLPDGAMLTLIRRTKTDPYGSGRDGYISPKAVEAIQRWCDAAGIEHGWLFRRIAHGKPGLTCLHPHTVGRILKIRAAEAGLPKEQVDRMSGHSMRVGAAQDMAAKGAEILPIMRSGGWKSVNVVAGYVRGVELARLAGWRG